MVFHLVNHFILCRNNFGKSCWILVELFIRNEEETIDVRISTRSDWRWWCLFLLRSFHSNFSHVRPVIYLKCLLWKSEPIVPFRFVVFFSQRMTSHDDFVFLFVQGFGQSSISIESTQNASWFISNANEHWRLFQRSWRWSFTMVNRGFNRRNDCCYNSMINNKQKRVFRVIFSKLFGLNTKCRIRPFSPLLSSPFLSFNTFFAPLFRNKNHLSHKASCAFFFSSSSFTFFGVCVKKRGIKETD